jgi:hypothetical protein
MMRARMPEQSSLAKALALALLVAVLCNGASFYLKRTGLIDDEPYRAYWAAHCGPESDGIESRHEWQCSVFTTPEEIARNTASQHNESIASVLPYVYQTSPAERGLKLVKDLFWLVLIAASMWLVAKEKVGSPKFKRVWPVGVFAGYSAVAFFVSIPVNGAFVAAAGLRSSLYLLVALLGQWLVPQRSIYARFVGALLVVELLLVPLELVRGIHIFHEWTPWALASRVAGTLVQPNSLGVFAAAALAFYYAFSLSRTWVLPLSIVALALVLLSGSGTGLVCAALALSFILRKRARPECRAAATASGLVLVALVVLALPILSGRGDIFASVWTGGRLTALRAALLDRGPAQVFFGSGLGVNTNLALNLAALGGHGAAAPAIAIPSPTDSALTGLLIQVGVLGTVMFYAMLLWAGLRDPPARSFYWVVALCSLTINVTELFPVNVLLGIALACSIWQDRRSE